MAITYPPYVEGKLPAQHGATLSIPYQLNRAVGLGEINNIQARVKTIATNLVVMLTETTDFKTRSKQGDYYIARFAIDADHQNASFVPGQYYKIQLACNGDNVYSTVGVFKYTDNANVKIRGLESTTNNSNPIQYIGEYSNTDTTEKVYEYQFDLYLHDEWQAGSGRQFHLFDDNDSPTSSTDMFDLAFELQPDQQYTMYYTVYTNNNLVLSTPGYIIERELSYKLDEGFGIVAQSDSNEGVIHVALQATEGPVTIQGSYRLYRKTGAGAAWHEIGSITMDKKDVAQEILYTDRTVQQGVEYTYAIARYTSTFVADKITSEPVICNFEDAFLLGGDGRQLKLRFNPKVSSFKNTILESKVDTIGGKYPFIFRNGITCYKEFPISGLIANIMDEKFYPGEDKLIEDVRESTNSDNSKAYNLKTNLTGDNIATERLYKLEVLNWLTNGKPKLFRSPTEGNYIIRLLNVSLTPNDTLGRMLHTFSGTAYEIAEHNYNNLFSFGFVGQENSRIENSYTEIYNLDDYQVKTRLDFANMTALRITDATINSEFILHYADGTDFKFLIGYSGYYFIDSNTDNNPIVGLTFDPKYRAKIEVTSTGKSEYRYFITQDEEEDNSQVTKELITYKANSVLRQMGASSSGTWGYEYFNALVPPYYSGVANDNNIYETELQAVNIRKMTISPKDVRFENELIGAENSPMALSEKITSEIEYPPATEATVTIAFKDDGTPDQEYSLVGENNLVLNESISDIASIEIEDSCIVDAYIQVVYAVYRRVGDGVK